MNKREEFDQNLARARALLKYREENLYPDEIIYGDIKRQMNLAEKIANGEQKHSKHLDEMTMGHTAVREIEDMDPEFSKAVTKLQYSLKQLMGVKI